MSDIASAYEDPLVVARFWSKVEVGRPTECWEWKARARANYGYGAFNPRPGTPHVRAHRFAYALVNGEPGTQEVVRHICDNPPCCNPDHLVAGSQAQNVSDMHERGRRKYSSRLTHDQIREIIARSRAGERQANIARRFGISASYVSNITRGKAPVVRRLMERK